MCEIVDSYFQFERPKIIIVRLVHGSSNAEQGKPCLSHLYRDAERLTNVNRYLELHTSRMPLS